MAGEGFKIADAFVEVRAKLDETAVTRAASQAGDRAGTQLTTKMRAAGKSSGDAFGKSFAGASEAKVRDSRGRFTKAYDGIGEGAGKSSGGKFGLSFGASLLGNITGTAAKMGSSLVGSLSDIGGKGGPYVGAGILAGVIAVGPLIGATIGAALTGGVALGAVGLGVAASLREPSVKAAFSDLKSDAVNILGEIGRDWAPTMLDVIADVRGDMKGIGSSLQTALAPAKGYVAPLVDGLTGLVKNVMPGFGALLANAGPVVNALASSFQEIGDALGDAFTTMSGSTGGMAAGLTTVAMIIGNIIRGGGQVIAWLSDAYVKTLDWGMLTLGWMSKIPGAGGVFKDWRDEISAIRDSAEGASGGLGIMGRALAGTSAATSQASESNEAMATRQRILNGTMSQGADEAGDLKRAMDALNGAMQSAEEAEIAYQASVDEATSAMKANGQTTDANTEKGRANRSALLDLARAGQTRAQAQYDQTAATKGTSAAEKAAATSYQNSRNQLIKVATQMFGNRTAAIKYADSIMAVPKSWNTSVKANTKPATNAITALSRKLKSIPDETVNIAMRITGNKNYASQAAAIAKGMSTGGPVTGPGRKGVDSQLRLLAPGEHVMTDKEVAAAGGHAAVSAWRKAILAGDQEAGVGIMSSSSSKKKKKTARTAPKPYERKWNPPKPKTPKAPRDNLIGWKPPEPKKPGVIGRPAGPGAGSPNIGKPKPPPGPVKVIPVPAKPIPDTDGGGSGGGYGGGDTYNIGTVMIDPAGVRSIQELAELVAGVARTARTYRTPA